MIDAMTSQWAPYQIDAILSIESRGFIMAGALAYNVETAFIPLRKPQKLPFKTHSVSYELEYGALTCTSILCTRWAHQPSYN